MRGTALAPVVVQTLSNQPVAAQAVLVRLYNPLRGPQIVLEPGRGGTACPDAVTAKPNTPAALR
jgi:hypothetical protein